MPLSKAEPGVALEKKESVRSNSFVKYRHNFSASICQSCIQHQVSQGALRIFQDNVWLDRLLVNGGPKDPFPLPARRDGTLVMARLIFRTVHSVITSIFVFSFW